MRNVPSGKRRPTSVSGRHATITPLSSRLQRAGTACEPSSPFSAMWWDTRRRHGAPSSTRTVSHSSCRSTAAQLRTSSSSSAWAYSQRAPLGVISKADGSPSRCQAPSRSTNSRWPCERYSPRYECVVERKRLMLTCPCVSIEWKTPPIQTVVVSDASSGTSWSPVRRICPWGRKLARSLAGSTTCAPSARKKDRSCPPSSSAARRSAPKCRVSMPGSRGVAASRGASLKSVAARADAAPRFLPRGTASRNASARSAKPRSAAPLTPG